MPKQHIDQSAQISYLLSFLAILVHRAGGRLTIEKLSEFSASDMGISMKLDVENDRVLLMTRYTPRAKGGDNKP
jgi:hypothetical protein